MYMNCFSMRRSCCCTVVMETVHEQCKKYFCQETPKNIYKQNLKHFYHPIMDPRVYKPGHQGFSWVPSLLLLYHIILILILFLLNKLIWIEFEFCISIITKIGIKLHHNDSTCVSIETNVTKESDKQDNQHTTYNTCIYIYAWQV